MTQSRNTDPGPDRVRGSGAAADGPFRAGQRLLGMEPPELPVAQLVRLTGLFGISENRARVALSRMVAGGEATSDGSGRYRLAGHLAARQSRQSASRAGATTAYDGEWWLAVVTTTGSAAEVRAARRRSLAYRRLAELREGVWMRPANLAVQLSDSLDGDIELMTARPGDAAALAQRLWDLPAWSARARDLLGDLDALARRASPRHWRRASSSRRPCCGTCRRTRCCPPSSCPADWPGGRLRATYDEWDARYRTTLRDWSRGG